MSGTKPAYVIAEVEVTDPAGFQEYVAAALPTLVPYKARLTVRDRPDVREGHPSAGDIVIVQFDSIEDARAWYESAAYQQAIPMRQKSASTRLFIVEAAAP